MVKQGVTVLYERQAPVVADIVFVHGLCGDPFETWSKSSVCWPRDLLQKDMLNARIMTWGYDSTVGNIKSFSSQNSIFGHSQNLLSDVARKKRDKDQVGELRIA